MANVSSNSKENFSRKIDQLMREDQRRDHLGFDKAAGFVNGLFCDLASIDVRFEFDPLSLDDCRCEKVTVNEYNVMCTLKQLPYEQMDLEGDGSSGAVKVRLNDDYQDSYDRACWEDVCTTSSGRRYLDTKKIMTALLQAIRTVIACEKPEASIVCQDGAGYLTLVLNLHLTGVYKFNILPAMWVSRKYESLKHFDEKISNVFDILDDVDPVECVQIVAKPTSSISDSLWRITFTDLEKRLVSLDKYQCVRHCLFAVNLLQRRYLVANGLPFLSWYNLRMMILRELIKIPRTKDWNMEKLPRRLDSLLKSIKASLNQKANPSIFTNVNVLGNCRNNDMKLLCREFGYIRKCTQKCY